VVTRFWSDLRTGYDYFEQHRRLPQVTAGADGRYRFAGLADASPAAAGGAAAASASR
jgi:murein L,D-transpeptidase YafK